MGLNVCVYGPTIDETGNVSKASARSFPFLKCTPVFYFVCFSWWPIISASLCLKSSVFFLDSWVYVGIEFLVDSYCSNLRKLSPCLLASMFFLVEKSAVKFTVSHLQSWFFIFPNSFQYFFLESWSSAVLMIAWVFSLDFLFFFFWRCVVLGFEVWCFSSVLGNPSQIFYLPPFLFFLRLQLHCVRFFHYIPYVPYILFHNFLFLFSC